MNTILNKKLISLAIAGVLTPATFAAERYSELPGLTDEQKTALDHCSGVNVSFTLRDSGIIGGIIEQYREKINEAGETYDKKLEQGTRNYTLTELLYERSTGIMEIPTPEKAMELVLRFTPQNAKDALERFGKGDGSFTEEDRQLLYREVFCPGLGQYYMSVIAKKAKEKQKNGEEVTSLEKVSLAHDLFD